MKNETFTDRRLWLGLVFLLVGFIWLLDNLDIIPEFIPDYLLNWKMFLIALGIYFIAGRQKPEVGIIMIAIGGIFLLRDYYDFRIRDVWHILWPAIFIIIGISLILRRSMRRGDDRRIGGIDEKKNDADFVDDFAILGGREIIIDSQNFKGGKVSAILGGSVIDMRSATLSDGNNVLDVLAMFGGTSVIVPHDWMVKVEVFSLLGGFSDKRDQTVKVIPHPGKSLTIKGFVMFGGGDIKYTK